MYAKRPVDIFFYNLLRLEKLFFFRVVLSAGSGAFSNCTDHKENIKLAEMHHATHSLSVAKTERE
jgi:hypothetical protein